MITYAYLKCIGKILVLVENPRHAYCLWSLTFKDCYASILSALSFLMWLWLFALCIPWLIISKLWIFLVVSIWYRYFMALHSNGLTITLHVDHCKLICLQMTLNLVFLLVIEFLKILKVIEVKFLELKTQENCKGMRIWMRRGVVFLLISSVRIMILSINFSLKILWYWMEWTWQRERGSMVSRKSDGIELMKQRHYT